VVPGPPPSGAAIDAVGGGRPGSRHRAGAARAPGSLDPVPAVRALYERFQVLIHELAKFGIVGAVCLVIDLSIFYGLHTRAGIGPLTSKVGSTVVSASCAYAGNRVWSFRHRARSGVGRELTLFMGLNAVGLAIGLAVIGASYYLLDLRSTAATNVANLLGIMIGTVFRFFTYKRFVFLHPERVPTNAGSRDEREAEAVLQV